MAVRLKLFVALLALCAFAHAAPPVTVTRTDWNSLVSRFNREYARRPPSTAHHAAVQQIIDRAYGEYFSNRALAAVGSLAEATALLGPTTRGSDDAQLDALQVQVLPVISRQDRPGLLRIRVQPFYTSPSDKLIDVTLVIRGESDADKPIFSTPIHLDFSAGPQALTLAKPSAEPGRYRIELIDAAGHAHRVGDEFVVAKSLDGQRINTARLLSTTRPTTQAAWDAQVLVRARNVLLTDNVDLNNPTFLTRDPLALAQSITDEAAAVMKGVDPFAGRLGDDWRGIPAGGNVIPARLYVPHRAPGHPAPLLICLPETTADENDPMDRLAEAPLQRFADQNGWIVLCARTVSMLASRDALAAALRTLGEDYAIDRSRVCLLGHGVGAIAAVDLTVTNPGTIAKLCLIGGGEFGGITQLPPTLQIVGTLDAQFDPNRAKASADYARDHRLTVEQRSHDAGHMLLLNEALPHALHWLAQ